MTINESYKGLVSASLNQGPISPSQRQTARFLKGRVKVSVYNFLFYFLPLLYFPAAAWAEPREVTFFPLAARVTELTKVRLQAAGKDLRKAVLNVPGRADPATFTTAPLPAGQGKITDITWRRLTAEEDGMTKALSKGLKQLQGEKNELLASLEGLNNQLQFWQQQVKARAKTPADAGTLAGAIGRNSKKVYQEKLALASALPPLEKRIKELEAEVKASTAGSQRNWEATIILVGAAAPEILLTYSYNLTDCGWRPAYRLDGATQEGKIRFYREAEVWQNSGQDWRDVDVQIALVPPAPLLAPLAIPTWVIKPRGEEKAKAKGPISKGKTAPSPAIDEGRAAEPPAALTTISGDIPLPRSGRRTIPAGASVKITIQEESWAAVFDLLARPGQGTLAYLRGSLLQPAAYEIPRGPALFFQNGVLTGRGDFFLSDKEGSVFFGQDPLVSVTRRQLPETKDGGKAFRRSWRLDAFNHHAYPIRLRIEEPLPRCPDERIKLNLSSTPAALADRPDVLAWEIPLAAGETKAVTYDVAIEAPPGLEIETGPALISGAGKKEQ